jgi:hypothetical protein
LPCPVLPPSVVKSPVVDAVDVIFDISLGIHIVVADPFQEIVLAVESDGCAEPFAVLLEKMTPMGFEYGTTPKRQENRFSMV